MSDLDFEQLYQRGAPAWDAGRPQPAIVHLSAQELITGRVLDCGCGTGENALYLASQGFEVVGIDASPTAIARAQEKAQQRGLTAAFQVADAFALEQLGQTFDTVLDCGLLHTFSAPDRLRYTESLSTVTAPGGRIIVLCFSEATIGQPGPPHRLSQADIRAAFQRGWRIDEIRPAHFEMRIEPRQSAAWLALVRRVVDGV